MGGVAQGVSGIYQLGHVLVSGLCINHITMMSLHERHGVSEHWKLDCLLKSLYRLTMNKTSKLCIICLLMGEGRTAVSGGFPSQRANNAESIFSVHNVIICYGQIYKFKIWECFILISGRQS